MLVLALERAWHQGPISSSWLRIAVPEMSRAMLLAIAGNASDHSGWTRTRTDAAMTVPNIFDFATKELSQDAVICWLVACARDAEGHHRQRGLDFVAALAGHCLDRPGECRITDVTKPERQYSRIDVYFQVQVDGSLVSFVVEDKGGTKMHGDQLDRYRKAVQDDKLEENHFEMDHIVPVAKGGQDWVDNFQLLCSNCNRIKGKGTQEAARAKIAKNKGIDFGVFE